MPKWYPGVSISPKKDPDSKIDVQVDLVAWLNGDTISTSSVTVSGVTADSSSNANGIVTARISGGNNCTTGKVTFRVTTAAGLEDDFSVIIPIAHN